MFGAQIAALRFAVNSVKRKVTWGALGGVLMLLGLVFFGIAFWVWAVDRWGTINTAMGFGAGLWIAGILAFLWSRRPPRVIQTDEARRLQNPMNSPALSTAALVNAVILGISAGRAVRRPRD